MLVKKSKEEHSITKITFTLRLSISGKMNTHNTKYPQTKTVVLLSSSNSAALLSPISPTTHFVDTFFSITIVISTVNCNVSVNSLCSLIVICNNNNYY